MNDMQELEIEQQIFNELQKLKSAVQYLEEAKETVEKSNKALSEMEKKLNLFQMAENKSQESISKIEADYNGKLNQYIATYEANNRLLNQVKNQLNEVDLKFDKEISGLKKTNKRIKFLAYFSSGFIGLIILLMLIFIVYLAINGTD